MPGLHPDVRLCHGPCDRYCPESNLSRCDRCNHEVCDDCRRDDPEEPDDIVCPGCYEDALRELRAHSRRPFLVSPGVSA